MCYAIHRLPQHHDRLQGCHVGRVLMPMVDLSSSFIEATNHKKGVMSWDALWVDPVCSDDCYLSWYNLPSPSLPTSGCLRAFPPPLCPFRLHSAPTPKHACTTYATALHPLSDYPRINTE